MSAKKPDTRSRSRRCPLCEAKMAKQGCLMCAIAWGQALAKGSPAEAACAECGRTALCVLWKRFTGEEERRCRDCSLWLAEVERRVRGEAKG